MGLLSGQHQGWGTRDRRRRVRHRARESAHPKAQGHVAAKGQGRDSKSASMLRLLNFKLLGI